MTKSVLNKIKTKKKKKYYLIIYKVTVYYNYISRYTNLKYIIIIDTRAPIRNIVFILNSLPEEMDVIIIVFFSLFRHIRRPRLNF